MIELRLFRYFLAVAEELHFGRAAERLRISQPPVSHAIRRLEEALGVKLLNRTSRVVTLTEPGQVFAEEARKVLAAADHAVAEARRAAGAGTAIRLGCTPYIPIVRLLAFLGALKERPLGAELVLTHLPASEQLERVRAGELDFAIVHEAEDYDDVEHELLFRGEPAVAYVRPDDALAERDVITPDDLRDEALVTFPRAARPAMYDRWLSMIAAAGYVFRTVTETSTAGARDLMLAVVGGEGVLLGSMFGKDLSEVGSMVVWRPLDPPLSIPGTVIAWQANPSRRLAAVSDLVREAAREVRERDVVN